MTTNTNTNNKEIASTNHTKSEAKDKAENKTKDPYNTQSDSRMKDFIPSSVNPDNNAYFAKYSNPLSSKGD